MEAFTLDFGNERPRVSVATFNARLGAADTASLATGTDADPNASSHAQANQRKKRGYTVDEVIAQELKDFTSAKDRWLDGRIEGFRAELEALESSFNGWVDSFLRFGAFLSSIQE